ncbi:MAG: hypothetical protein QW286_02695, partial [Candidatus Aenigmatarchaeota archaeon]
MRIPKVRIRSQKEKKPFAVRYIARRFKKGYKLWIKKKQKEKMGIGGPSFIYQPIIYAPYSKKDIRKEGKEEKKPYETEVAKEGVEIPTEYVGTGGPIAIEESREMLQHINITYHLIPRFPKKGDLIFAYANIVWDPQSKELVYRVIEPRLTQRDREIIEFVKKELEERLDVDFVKLGEIRAKSVLKAEILNILSEMKEQIDESKKLIYIYYIEKEIIGLGKIETLMNDPNIEDVSCDGVGIPIYVYHRDPKIGSIK